MLKIDSFLMTGTGSGSICVLQIKIARLNCGYIARVEGKDSPPFVAVCHLHSGQWMDDKSMVLNYSIACQIFLNDAFNHLRRCGMVTDAIGIDEGDQSFLANTQAVGFGAKDAAWALVCGLVEFEFPESLFEVIPGGEPGFKVATQRFSLISAQQDVALNLY